MGRRTQALCLLLAVGFTAACASAPTITTANAAPYLLVPRDVHSQAISTTEYSTEARAFFVDGCSSISSSDNELSSLPEIAVSVIGLNSDAMFFTAQWLYEAADATAATRIAAGMARVAEDDSCYPTTSYTVTPRVGNIADTFNTDLGGIFWEARTLFKLEPTVFYEGFESVGYELDMFAVRDKYILMTHVQAEEAALESESQLRTIAQTALDKFSA